MTVYEQVKELLLKQEWFNNHNVTFDVDMIYFRNLEKTVKITEDQITIKSYNRFYDGQSERLELVYTQIFELNSFHYDLTIDDIVELLEKEMED